MDHNSQEYYTIPTVSVFQLNVSFTIYAITQSKTRLRKTLHPMLTFIFSVIMGLLLANIHITKARIVSNKVRRSCTTFWVRHNTNATAFATRFKLTPQL